MSSVKTHLYLRPEVRMEETKKHAILKKSMIRNKTMRQKNEDKAKIGLKLIARNLNKVQVFGL